MADPLVKDPLVKITWRNNNQPALNETNLNVMQTNIETFVEDNMDNVETYVEDNMQEMQRKVDGVVSGMPIGSGCDYFGFTLPSDDFMWADGSAISRTTYAELFAIIGTTYGQGDGSTTFNLPDKRERVSVAYKSGSTNFGALGNTGGEVNHTLTVAEMPSHTHIQNQHRHSINCYDGTSSSTAQPAKTVFSSSGSTTFYTAYATPTNQNTGGGQAHNNMPPYLVCNYIIKVQ